MGLSNFHLTLPNKPLSSSIDTGSTAILLEAVLKFSMKRALHSMSQVPMNIKAMAEAFSSSVSLFIISLIIFGKKRLKIIV